VGIKNSAGIVLYRVQSGVLELFLVHPGGPFWAKKDEGAWSIPKGEIDDGADLLETAKREFHEETGSAINGEFVELTPLKQRGGKIVYAWAVDGDIDAASVRSNLFSMEWPPRSGLRREFPEIDRAGWFAVDRAMEKLLPGQRGFIAELQAKLGIEANASTASE
jgi:predicted NUDIX family NTP pyrophosphohydrolase